jgi:hypothetical protein
MKLILYSTLITMIGVGCSSNRLNLSEDGNLRDISKIDRNIILTMDNAGDILKHYVIDFTIPNPLITDNSSSASARLGGNDESVILCRAVLLDEFSTEADILSHCRADSLFDEAATEYRAQYVQTNIKDNTFRVLISMSSNFSPKSMEPEYWAMYLENPNGVMIEPMDRTASPVITEVDSVSTVISGNTESPNRSFSRRTMKRDITLYFKKTTFFGENLLGGDVSYLVLVMSREQRTVARVAWKLNSKALQ